MIVPNICAKLTKLNKLNFKPRCQLSNRLTLGVRSCKVGETTLAQPIKIPFLKILSSFLCGSHRVPVASR